MSEITYTPVSIIREQLEPIANGFEPVLVARFYPGFGADDPTLLEQLPEAYLPKPADTCQLQPGDRLNVGVREHTVNPAENAEVAQLLAEMLGDEDNLPENAIEIFELIIFKVAGDVCNNCPLKDLCPAFNAPIQ